MNKQAFLLASALGLSLGMSLSLAAAPAPAMACGGDGITSAEIEDQIQQGYFQDRQGDYQGAIDIFKKVLTTNPENRKAHYFLANTYWRDSDYIDASQEWAAVMRMNPADRIGIEAREWLASNARYIKAGPVVQTVAGGSPGYADGTMSQARFDNPSSMVLSPTGNLYIADTGNHRIRRITPDGKVMTVAGSGEAGYADGPARAARLDSPRGLALDSVGNLYFCDGPRVRFVTPDGNVGTLAGGAVQGWRDGPFSEALLWAPRALAVDPAGNVYVADGGTAIRQIKPNGEVHLLAGSATAAFADGVGPNARFRSITTLKWTTEGVLICADAGAHRLRAVGLNGNVKSLPGCDSNGYVDGPIGRAHFNNVSALAVDKHGNLLVADTGNHAIRRINSKLEVETLVGGAGAGSDDGRGINAHFRDPVDIAVWNNNVFVLDRQMNAIRRVTLGPKDM